MGEGRLKNFLTIRQYEGKKNDISKNRRLIVENIKEISEDKSVSNVIIKDEVKMNMESVSFNNIPGNNYIYAQEADTCPGYRQGPININDDGSFWVLTEVNNMAYDESVIAENVRLSVRKKKISENEFLVETVILCDDSNPNEVKQSIQFKSQRPFNLEICPGTASFYSKIRGFDGTKGVALKDEIMSENGTLIGFWEADGRIPGGSDNLVTVAIKVSVKIQDYTNIDNYDKGIRSGEISNSKQKIEKNISEKDADFVHVNKSHLSGIYLGHSGFFIESKSASMIFDWREGNLPEIDSKKPLYIFISHVHNDHFNRDVFKLVDKYPHVEIFLGYDNNYPELNDYFDQLPNKVADVLSRFSGEQKLFSDDGKMEINTLRSTDEGVAFIVNIDGKTLYHAGDLFLMQVMDKEKFMQMSSMAILSGSYMGDYEDYLKNSKREFIEYTEPLRGKTIDYAMIPLDPRVYTVAEETIKRYMDVATIKSWSPMHLWGKYEFVDEFLGKHPEYADTMIGTSKSPRVKWQISLGERYDI